MTNSANNKTISFSLALCLLGAAVFAQEELSPKEEAVQALQEYLKRNPDDSKRGKELAGRLLELKRFKEAEELYQKLLDQNPKDKQLWDELIYNYVDRKLYNSASVWLRKYFVHFPKDGKAYDLLTFVEEKRGKRFKSIGPLRQYVRKNPNDRKMMLRLARLLVAHKNMDEAAKYYGHLIKMRPNTLRIWWEVIGGYLDLKQHEKAILWLERYNKRFPTAPKGVSQLAALYQQAGNTDQAEGLLKIYLEKRPADAVRARDYIDLLISRERYRKAEGFLLKKLESDPAEVLWLVRLAEVYSFSGRPAKAAKIYEKILERKGETTQTLKSFGENAFYGENFEVAYDVLMRAEELAPEDADIHYFLAETEFARGRKDAAKKWAVKAIDGMLLRGDARSQRRRLRLEGKLAWSVELNTRYETLAGAFKDDSDVLTSWIEACLANQKIACAESVLARFLMNFPEKERSYYLYSYEILTSKKLWLQAIAQLKKWLAVDSEDVAFRKLLAEATVNAQHYAQAKRVLEQLPSDMQNSKALQDLKWTLREKLGPHTAAAFRYYHLPGDTMHRLAVSQQGRVSDHIEVIAEVASGFYKHDETSFKRRINDGELKVAYDGWRNLRASIFAGARSGGSRNAISPGVELSYQALESLTLRTSYKHRSFWKDFALPVSAGALASELVLGFQSRPMNRIYLNGQYLYNHYLTGADADATRHQWVPEVGVVMLEGGGFAGRPYWTAAYQLFAEEASGDQAFFNKVPLIRKTRGHCLNSAYSQWWKPRVLEVDFYGYGCVDGTRSLGVGDLYGVSGGIRWAALSWLDVRGRYEYGRESSLGVVGQSHTVEIKLEATFNVRK